MSWLQFIAAIAWPLVALAVALIYRPQFVDLFGRLKSGKVAGVEVNLVERQLAQIEKIAHQKQLPQLKTSSVEGVPPLDTLRQKVTELSAVSPAAGILYAWTELQSTLAQYARSNLGAKYSPRLSMTSLFDLLLKHRLIDQINFDILTRLRTIRNQAAHPELGVKEPTGEDADNFAQYVVGIISAIEMDAFRGVYDTTGRASHEAPA